MTLDEHIWEEEKFIRSFAGIAHDTRLHNENGKSTWLAEQYEKSQHEHEERKSLLEELKSLRIELEKNSKELEVYKQAFELACWDYASNILDEASYNCLLQAARREVTLQKARGEE